jgi:uncharacterized membrane protein (DUF106 family)
MVAAIELVLSFLRKNWKIILFIIIVALTVMYVYNLGVNDADAKWLDRYNTYVEQSNEKIRKLEEESDRQTKEIEEKLQLTRRELEQVLNEKNTPVIVYRDRKGNPLSCKSNDNIEVDNRVYLGPDFKEVWNELNAVANSK